MELDASNPTQVTGQSVLRADLGVGGRHLLVVSGTALAEYRIDSDETHRTECRVLLRVPAGTIEQSTVHTGLASIANDDTEWVFATDESRVEVDAAGDLVLVTNLAVMGEPSGLHRFSYQVVATTRVVVAEISGVAAWPTAWFRPANTDPSALAGRVTVVANERTVTPLGGPFGGTEEHLVPVTPGQVYAVSIGERECTASYRISEPPRGRELKVVVTAHGFDAPDYVSFNPVTPNGDIHTLTTAQPVRGNVDFRADAFVGPR